jgi:hypothetical protein
VKNKITIQSRITRKEYAREMTWQLLKTPYMMVIVLVGWGLVVYNLSHLEVGQYYIIMGLVMLSMPVVMYFTIGQAFDKNKLFNEQLEFTMGDKVMDISGQTFRSTYTWEQVTKVLETDKYFLLYEGRLMLSIISKQGIGNEEGDKLRTLFQAKNKLK